ncbi:SHOCT domain-containing protein [Ktedonosporobacter rubrisoli]|uniref:SHOCT domain-containing protein n=1 Tax=Ktedonosporobacter rubrisoli TaxID=2509675 RepID=A0A4P6JKI7_KTERU|nr:SHOCT domain-containing protein [Ktedonosporobacter rubrisoli]QBD75573.1 SHOCT domain-containing protein [Ktedonosporobacter rubrisoli]
MYPIYMPIVFFMFMLGKLIPLLLIGLLVWLIVRALTRRPQMWGTTHHIQSTPIPPMPPNFQPAQPSAMEILRQRYARGEIDGATFDQMRERLEASMPHSEPKL